MVVQLKSGRTLEQARDLDAEVPLAAQLAKLRGKAAALLGSVKAGRLVSAIDVTPA